MACSPSDPGQAADSGSPEVLQDDLLAPGLTTLRHSHSASMLQVQWDQQVAGQTRVVAQLDGERLEAPLAWRETGPQEQLFLGLPFDSRAELWVEIDGQASGRITVITGGVPDGVPTATVWVNDAARTDDSFDYLMLSTNGSTEPDRGWWVLIVDRQGRVVWAQEPPAGFAFLHPQLSWEGDSLLLDFNSFWGRYDKGAASKVVEQWLTGEEIRSIPTPGLHHPFQAMPGGALAWGQVEGHGDEERLMIAEADGSTRQLWACSDVAETATAPDGCISNTLRYDADRDSWLFSFFTLETVFEIDGSTGETLRWFGHLDGSWAFEPPDSAFWWQHGANWTEAGTLLLSTKGTDAAEETVVREYAVDEDGQALVELWSFGEGEGIYGSVLGEAWRLPGGNTLHNMGSASRIREITPDGQVVWDIGWSRDKWMGRSTPLPDLYALVPDQGR